MTTPIYEALTACEHRCAALEAVVALLPKALEYIKAVEMNEAFGRYPDAGPGSLAKTAAGDRMAIEQALKALDAAPGQEVAG